MAPQIERTHIAEVAQDGVCTGCGTCSGICPVGAIRMHLDSRKGVFAPLVNVSTCTDCGLCWSCCPPVTWSNRPVTKHWDPCLGDYLSVFAAYSSDERIRRESASGGFITTLLLHLIRSGTITGAVVTQREANDPLRCRAHLACCEEDILNAKGSQYAPVPFDEIIRVLLRLDADRHRIAVVGLPCHIEGIFRASQHFQTLRRLLRFKISLVCGRTPSLLAYDYILRQCRIARSAVADLANRGGGWPGFMTLTLRNGSVKRIAYRSYLSMGTVLSSPVFTPTACQLCADPGGFCSDVTACDAWLPRFRDNKDGVNLILVRSRQILDVLEQMRSQGKLILLQASAADFLEANRDVMIRKLVSNQAALPLLLGRRALLYSQGITYGAKPHLFRKLRLFVYYLHIRLLSQVDLAAALRLLNRPVLFYFKAIKRLCESGQA